MDFVHQKNQILHDTHVKQPENQFQKKFKAENIFITFATPKPKLLSLLRWKQLNLTQHKTYLWNFR